MLFFLSLEAFEGFAIEMILKFFLAFEIASAGLKIPCNTSNGRKFTSYS